jgi:uncharacterized protein YgiM (DUF1202 family)
MVLRIGRCSNDPQNCRLATSKAELPYAGIDSVCPECRSPLAAIAPRVTVSPVVEPTVHAPSYPQSSDAPPAQSQMQRAPTPRVEANPNDVDYSQGRGAREDYDGEPRSGDTAMRLTQIAIAGAAIALVGFFAWRFFLQPKPVSDPNVAVTAGITEVGGQQVTPISPRQMRRVIVPTQARGIPNVAGPIIAQLPAGSVLDVSGQIQVEGVTWLRVLMPNDSSKVGFVRDDQMENLGDGTLAVTPVDQLPGTNTPPVPIPGVGVAPGIAAPPVIGPIQSREPTTFYIASRQANVRQEANATSGKMGTFEFSDPITIIGQRTVGPTIWYQVQLPSGGTGWVNGRLVSTTPRDVPVDNASAPSAPKPKVTTPDAKPDIPPDPPSDSAPSFDNKTILTAVGPGATLRVNATVANLRKEAGASGNSIVEVLQQDTVVTVEEVRILAGVPWYRVTSPSGSQGWVSGRTVVTSK